MIEPVLATGTLVADRYRITGLIARGGMGAVHAATDERLRRDVAIKTLRPELVEDASLVRRFEREAQTIARLGHPGVAQALDFGTTPSGVLYLVMERVEGETLSALLKREGKLAPFRAADIVEQALGALASAHAAGVVHRDLKPANLMVTPTGESREVVKVLDFGIAHIVESAAHTRLTQTGMILGTPNYMAPEQALGQAVDGRADVYAMGVILWCLLTGQKPFPGADLGEVVEGVLNVVPPFADALVPEVPHELARIAAFAMQKDREQRFASADAMGSALVAFRLREPAAIQLPAPTVVSSVPERTGGRPRGVLLLGAAGLALTLSSCVIASALGGLGVAVSMGAFEGSAVPVFGAGAPQAPSAPAPGGPPHGVAEACVRARRCCEAYAVVMRNPVDDCQVLESPFGQAARCDAAAAGYAMGLRSMGADASVCEVAP